MVVAPQKYTHTCIWLMTYDVQDLFVIVLNSYTLYVIFIGYCINTTFYDRGHVSDALPSLRGNALPRHERGHKMLYLYNNLIIISN